MLTHLTSKQLALHLSSSDLHPQSHRSLPYLSFSGVQVTVEDTGLPQGSNKIITVPVVPLDASLPQPPVMETGEAGPPGRMTSSKLPKGTDGSMMPVQGFAGAPGETHSVHSAQYVSQHCFTFLMFFFSFIATPQVKSTDSLKPSTPLILGKYTLMFLCCITTLNL